MAHRPWMHLAWIGLWGLGATASQAALLPDITPVGEVALPYSHRFTTGERLVSTPTFTVASGLSEGLEASLRLALDSDIARAKPEWEPRLTYELGHHAPWRLAVAAAYNTASLSGDGALLGSYRLGALTLRGSACGFSSGYGVGGPTAAMGLGMSWRLNDWLTTTADYAGVLATRDMEAIANQLPPLGLVPAWRLGLLLGRSFELYVTNSHTHTLEGLHRGSDHVQVGFEYRIPLRGFRPPTRTADVPMPDLRGVPDPFAVSMAPPTPRPSMPPLEEEVPPVRMVPAIAPAVAPELPPPALPEAPAVREVGMGAHGYSPAILTVRRGTVVRWINHDRISHTATALGLWDSRWKKPGKAFERRFDRTGIFLYHCKRHPHERGVVKVN